jgi:hypothetical protein
VAELPAPKKKPERLVLPVRPRTVVEDYEFEIDVEDLTDFEATGGRWHEQRDRVDGG